MLEREQFDLLHFHEPFVPFLSPIILRLSTSVNIATFHAYGGFSPSYEFGSKVMKGEAARLHGRIAVSGAAKHFIDRYFPGEYKVIPNGVDVDRFRRAVRSRAGRTAPATSCSSAGSSRGRASSSCSRPTGSCARPAATAGSSSSARGPLGKEARRYVATRRLRGVEFLGRVSDEEKAQLFRTADVYVSPATGGESFGIVLLEAMAAGTAIVASDIHGYKGVVRRGREALLVPPREPKAIAAASPGCSATTTLRAEMGDAGRERAQEFSWERVTAKVDDFYGVVIRRLAARGELPPAFHAPVPPSPRGACAAPSRRPAARRPRAAAATERRRRGRPPAADRVALAARRAPDSARRRRRPAPRTARARARAGRARRPRARRAPAARPTPNRRRRARGRPSTPPSSSGIGPKIWIGTLPRRCSPGTGRRTGRSAGRPGRRSRSPSAAAGR